SCRLFRTASPTAVGKHDDISTYQHANISLWCYILQVLFLFSEESGAIISVYKGKASTGLYVG
ncbi:hypothetical protein ACPBZR_23985, partial [Escherichia coli]|uniref:hypothetical protein n=1 Tax=Escherichia coli TaxID=562 RepID=UPI003C2E6B84